MISKILNTWTHKWVKIGYCETRKCFSQNTLKDERLDPKKQLEDVSYLSNRTQPKVLQIYL